MLSEKCFEDIISKYPELLEESLTLKGRQVSLYGRRMDLLFEDKHGRKLVVELKIGPIRDKHIGQILSYEGMILSADDPTLRVMLVGNRVPPNIKKVLDHHGIAWKEITFTKLEEFLLKKGADKLLKLVKDSTNTELSHSAKKKRQPAIKGQQINNSSFEEYPRFIKVLYDKVINPIGSDLSRSEGTRYTSIFLRGNRILHVYDRDPSKVQIHIDKRYLKNNSISLDVNALKEKFKVGNTGDDYPIYIGEDSDLDYLANFLKSIYK